MKLQNLSKFTICILVIAMLLSTPFLSTRPVVADPLGQITRYSTPSGNANAHGIVTGPDNNIWFTAYTGNKITKFVPSTALFTSYSLPSGYSKPEVIINGLDQSMWFGAYKGSARAVGEINTNGNFTMYDLPDLIDADGFLNQAIKSLAFMNGKLWIARAYTRYIQKLSSNGDIQNIEISTLGATTEYEKDTYALHAVEYDPIDNCMFASATGGSGFPGRVFIQKFCKDSSQVYEKYQGGVPTDMLMDNNGKLWLAGTVEYGYMDLAGDFTYFSAPTSGDIPYRLTLGADGNVWYTAIRTSGGSGGKRLLKVDINDGSATEYLISSSDVRPLGITVGPDNNIWFTEYKDSKISKIGVGAVIGVDSDNDGLTTAQELQQGTSDLTADTDNDGLSDYTESQWNTARDDVFCNPATSYCEYPDPLQQDVYIETDWMSRPNDGPIVGYSTQPSSYSVDMIKTAFTNQGIKAHIDTGQLGGGNEVPYEEGVQFAGGHETSVIDFWDYRDGGDGISQNFATNRKDIYHYMLLGNHMSDSGYTTVTGASIAGTDDIFVSYGLIKENPVGYGVLDIAIAGTMHHELGHSLCLSDTSGYAGQPPACVFSGIDQNGTTDYPSAMNYLYQMVLVDYSDGTNSSNDHDDWGAITPKDFAFNESLGSPSPGATLEQVKQAAKIRKEKGIKVERKNGKFQVTQTRNGRTEQLN